VQKYFTQKYYADKRQSASTKNKAMWALVWVSFAWGTTWLASKEAVTNVPALQIIAIRQLVGGALYIIYFIFKKHPWPRVNSGSLFLFLAF
jgi:drug/metabolite transporter (DMT)-like permease